MGELTDKRVGAPSSEKIPIARDGCSATGDSFSYICIYIYIYYILY